MPRRPSASAGRRRRSPPPCSTTAAPARPPPPPSPPHPRQSHRPSAPRTGRPSSPATWPRHQPPRALKTAASSTGSWTTTPKSTPLTPSLLRRCAKSPPSSPPSCCSRSRSPRSAWPRTSSGRGPRASGGGGRAPRGGAPRRLRGLHWRARDIGAAQSPAPLAAAGTPSSPPRCRSPPRHAPAPPRHARRPPARLRLLPARRRAQARRAQGPGGRVPDSPVRQLHEHAGAPRRARRRAPRARGRPRRRLWRSVAAAHARARAPVAPGIRATAAAEHQGDGIGLAGVSAPHGAPPHAREPDALRRRRRHPVRVRRRRVRPLGPVPARGRVRRRARRGRRRPPTSRLRDLLGGPVDSPRREAAPACHRGVRRPRVPPRRPAAVASRPQRRALRRSVPRVAGRGRRASGRGGEGRAVHPASTGGAPVAQRQDAAMADHVCVRRIRTGATEQRRRGTGRMPCPEAHAHAGLPCREAAGGSCAAVAAVGAGDGVGVAVLNEGETYHSEQLLAANSLSLYLSKD
jgi:hypothetical protein